jgi:DNA processing protein
VTEKKYLLALSSFVAFGPARLGLLIGYFKSPKRVWQAKTNELLGCGLKRTLVDQFVSHRSNFDIEEYIKRLKKYSVSFVIKNDKSYPKNLAEIDTAPLVLYVKGILKQRDVNSVAIVGSRRMTSYGKEVAERFATQLCNWGVSIISGLAFGVDAKAHEACIEAGGRAIAVLASGLDIVSPRSNQYLADRIVSSGGALISEYPLGYPPQKSSFPNRNRIISGMAKAVLVIEGLAKSGTIHTAKHAAEQGREVFCVPGQITSPMSGAPHYLIQNGAKIAFAPADILRELDLQMKVDYDAIEKVLPSSEEEDVLLSIIDSEPLHLDEVARISGLKVSDISARLTIMEMKGMVRSLGGGVYKKS